MIVCLQTEESFIKLSLAGAYHCGKSRLPHFIDKELDVLES
jgi:hypothetical protein